MMYQDIDEDIIVVGDKVDVVSQSGSVYRTMIEDKLEGDIFLAGVPNVKGIFMSVEQDDDIYMVFYRESGRYIAQMKVVALEKRGEIRYMWLQQKTMPQKNQRREAYRLPVDFEVEIFEYTEDVKQDSDGAENEAIENEAVDGETKATAPETGDEMKQAAIEMANCKDLSVTGIALLTRKKYEVGEEYMLGLYLGKTPASIRTSSIRYTEPPMYLTATVKRCALWRTTSTFNTGMHFFGMTKYLSDEINKFVLKEQQKQIKRRRRLI